MQDKLEKPTFVKIMSPVVTPPNLGKATFTSTLLHCKLNKE